MMMKTLAPKLSLLIIITFNWPPIDHYRRAAARQDVVEASLGGNSKEVGGGRGLQGGGRKKRDQMPGFYRKSCSILTDQLKAFFVIISGSGSM